MSLFDEYAEVAAAFGWTHGEIMECSPALIRAYLGGHRRNLARNAPGESMIAGFVHLSREDRQKWLNIWATIARDEIPPAGSVRPDGAKIVTDVADWLKEHGKGFPTNA